MKTMADSPEKYYTQCTWCDFIELSDNWWRIKIIVSHSLFSSFLNESLSSAIDKLKILISFPPLYICAAEPRRVSIEEAGERGLWEPKRLVCLPGKLQLTVCCFAQSHMLVQFPFPTTRLSRSKSFKFAAPSCQLSYVLEHFSPNWTIVILRKSRYALFIFIKVT